MHRVKQLVPRLTYTRVTAAIAILLVAVGGGYSLAFSGTGTLQKENEIGIAPQGSPEVIRTIRGIGEIKADCFGNTGSDTTLYLKNTSGEGLVAYVDKVGQASGLTANPAVVEVANGGSGEIDVDVSEHAVYRVHVFPADGSKAPQARATLAHVDVAAELTCQDVQVAVLSLSTEE